MLRVTFTGGDAPQFWLFDPDDVGFAEAEQIEEALGGMSWDQFLQGVTDNRARIRRVLLWHLQRRDHPDLQLRDMPDYRMGDMQVEFGTAEIDKLITAARENRDRAPERIDRVIATLEAERVVAAIAESAIEQGDVEADPKAPEPPADGTPPALDDPVMPDPSGPSETSSSPRSPKRTGSARGRSTS